MLYNKKEINSLSTQFWTLFITDLTVKKDLTVKNLLGYPLRLTHETKT